jgi:toxin ParE1/3/4
MKVVWTETALADLDEILAYTAEHYPSLIGPLERRIRAVVARVADWPESARQVDDRVGVHVVPLVRYPYRIFYRVADEAVELLHIHHAARDESEQP